MKKKFYLVVLIFLFCFPFVVACNPESESLANPPKYIGYAFDNFEASIVSASIIQSSLEISPMSETLDEPIEIKPDSDLNIVLLYENEKRDMIVDVIVNDSVKGNNQVYSSTSQNNKIESIETVYSDERNTWITEVTLIIKSDNTPVNNRTIEIKETTFLRDLIKEGKAEVDSEAETVAIYTILSKIDINGEVKYGRIGDKTTIDEPSAGGREFVSFYYYEGSNKLDYIPDNDGKYEFLNKPIDLQVEWKNLSYKIEYFVDGVKYGDIANFTYSGNNDILRSVSVKSNVAGTKETGEYFDGWYLDSSLLGERITDEESLIALAGNLNTEITLKLHGQILHSRFDPDRNFFTYKSAQEYSYDGYAIAFNYDTMFESNNSNYMPQTLTIPAVVNGKKIDVIEGLKDYWQSDVHGIGHSLAQNLIISDGISHIAENALKTFWTSISLPSDIDIADPSFGNWFNPKPTIIYRP